MTSQSDEPMDFMNLPLPSKSNVLTEAQDGAESMSATPFAEPPTIATPKSNAQKQREYRQRQAASASTSATPFAEPPTIVTPKSNAQKQREYRQRQAASASTSATPFAEPPTIATPKSNAQKQREYRQRKAASRTLAQAIAARKSDTERQRNLRLRKAVNLVLDSGSLESTTASSSRVGVTSNDVQTDTQRQLTHQQLQTSAVEPAQVTVQPGTSFDQIEVRQTQSTWNTKWSSSIMRFKSNFVDNDFRYACSVCDRLCFKNDLKPITAAQLEVISEWFIKKNRRLYREEYEMVCNTCKRSLNKKSMPPLAKVMGFSYQDQPPGPPPLVPISERLISPRLPFVQLRRLRHDFYYGVIGPVSNVPVNVQEMIKCLLRQLNKDDVINVNIKRNLAHNSVYIRGNMSKSTISAWLTVLQKSPLYRMYENNVDMPRLHPTMPFLDDKQDDSSNRIENISAENTPKSEILASRQHIMILNEDGCHNMAPGHKATPLTAIPFTIIYNRHAEELSFPSIHFGQPRRFNKGVSVSPYMIESSEKRRRDRRGATLPSRSNVFTEAQDAAASMSVMPFVEPPTIATPKSNAQRQREYRQRLAASRTPAQAIAARKSDTERQRNLRLRKTVNLVVGSGSLESTTASSSQRQLTHQQRQTSAAESAQVTVQPGTSFDQIEVRQTQSTWNTKWSSSIMRFKSTFLDNDFGYACSVCDRLWFKNDLKPITPAQLQVILEWFIKNSLRLDREEYVMACNTCKRTLNKKLMPLLAKVNGFTYPDQPPGLPPLDPISERLISPRLPFMQMRRLRHNFSYGIVGQVINVPVDVQEMVKCLPRQLNEDDVINVNIKRNLAHNSVYIRRYMSKSTISAWLTVLQKSPLYRLYKINVDLSRLHSSVPFLDDKQDDPSNRIENISVENTPESEILASRQHTMILNEEGCLNMAPGHKATPRTIIYDRHAEELSFPSIYFGRPRRFNKGVSVSPYMIASSEIRRHDRRGATPQKILYVAMNILRLRMVDGIYSTFRNVSVTENVSRRMLEDTEFLKECVIQNVAFMKTVPNSVQYWASRKRDLFAIIRLLGKPTVFLTISANEIRWMKLLTILLKLSKKYPGKTAKDLNTSERCTLVSDDPVTCCIYFYKLVGSLMKMLKSKQSYNPFGNYFVKDYFLRIEFQPGGSPQAHILLWLNDDPHETVSENMLRTIRLVEKLSSVARDDVPNNSVYANQIHKHSSTCTKRGETTCRFGMPYWPMPTTRVLVPIPQFDGRRQALQQKAKELRTSFGKRRYACMDEFLNANGLTFISYLDIVRSTLRRPTLVFKRNFDELMTNTFNPYLAGEVNSNISIQFILDEYSCAEYVVEYVNKSAHGMSNLRREFITMMQEHPNQDYTDQLKAFSMKLLNAVEMSAQEAAWYLLRQPMSETSRQVVYIPTVWPTERPCCRKRRQQMDREGIDGDSTDVWTKNIIQRYEERPPSLEQVYLAEFASWYANANDFVDEEDDVHVDDDEDSEAVPEARTSRAPKLYRRRLLGRVIRYRRYDIDETVNYKREMVLLYVQFRNEMSEIIDQNKFLQLFEYNKDTIMERHSLFETNLNIENVIKELEKMMILQNDDNSNLQEKESRTAFDQRLLGEYVAVKREETQECDEETAVLRACKIENDDSSNFQEEESVAAFDQRLLGEYITVKREETQECDDNTAVFRVCKMENDDNSNLQEEESIAAFVQRLLGEDVAVKREETQDCDDKTVVVRVCNIQSDDNSNLQEEESRAAFDQRLLGEYVTVKREETQECDDQTALLTP